MRGNSPSILDILLLNAVVVVGFVIVAVAMVRRARDPKTVPRDKLEAWSLPHLKNPTLREKLYFAALLAAGVAAPWLTWYFAQ